MSTDGLRQKVHPLLVYFPVNHMNSGEGFEHEVRLLKVSRIYLPIS